MADKKTSKTEEKRLVSTKEVVVVLPVVKAPSWLQGFVDFVREQGVVGLAIGLALGTYVKQLVDQLVASFINPIIGLLLPGSGSLPDKAFHISLWGKTGEFRYGAFVSSLIGFIVVAAVIYFVVKGLKLDKIDKKKA